MPTTRELDKLQQQLHELARECYRKGPGYAQEGVVLRKARRKFSPKGVGEEQTILDCWHDLFRTGELEWGYSIDNPGPPFFHVRQQPESNEFIP